MRIQIREGNSGILYLLRENGLQEPFFPDCDLKETDRILNQFYAISKDGISIRDSFWDNGINWFPTAMSLLCWRLFYNYVKYRRFFEKYPLDDHEFVFVNRGDLANFYHLLLKYSSQNTRGVSYTLNLLKNRISALVLKFHNQRIFRFYPQASLFFFRHSLKDFRTMEIKRTLDELGIQYLETVTYTMRQLFSNLLTRNPQPLFFLIQLISNDALKPFSISKTTDPLLKRVFAAAVSAIQDQINSFRSTYEFFKKLLTDVPVRCLYGTDDTNYLYYMIYACQTNGMKTIGHQHGASYGPFDFPYILKGFGQGEYRWFDTIVVWGEYWKERFLRHARYYSEEQIEVGTNMRPVLRPTSPDRCGNRERKHILFPAEEKTDTYTVGKYICALQDLDYVIYMKFRPDEEVARQVETYCLSREREKKIVFVDGITDDLMADIDIVAGTYSTVIFELLPYMKETWYLATKFVYAQDLVDMGIAKLIRLEHLEEDISRITGKVDQDLANRVNSVEPLREVLRRELS